MAKNIAHTYSATVNDVVMTAAAAGYADLFRSRGEPIEGVSLRAFVPVSLHQEQPGQARGNIDAGMLVPLPIGERDDIRRLEKIAAERPRRCWQRMSQQSDDRKRPRMRSTQRRSRKRIV